MFIGKRSSKEYCLWWFGSDRSLNIRSVLRSALRIGNAIVRRVLLNTPIDKHFWQPCRPLKFTVPKISKKNITVNVMQLILSKFYEYKLYMFTHLSATHELVYRRYTVQILSVSSAHLFLIHSPKDYPFQSRMGVNIHLMVAWISHTICQW